MNDLNWETDLEIIFQKFTDLIEEERNANWKAGDLLTQVLDRCSKKERRILVGQFAELANCSRAKIEQLYRVSKAFPPEERALDHKWSFHLAVLEKAGSLGDDPRELLNLALQEGWSQREVTEYCTDGSHRTYDRCSTCKLKQELEEIKKQLEKEGKSD